MRYWFGSVRAKVALGAVLVVAVALTAVGILITALTAATMIGDAETVAEVQARNLAIVAEAGRLDTVLDVDAAETTILQVVRADGTVLAASHQLKDLPALGDSVPLPGQTSATTVRVERAGSPAVDFRVVGIGGDSPDGRVAVFAGVSLAEAGRVLASLTRVLLVGFSLVLLVVAATSWAVITRALRPVDAIRAEVDQLAGGSLDRRVPVPTHRDEIQRLALTMNRMLARLESTAQRQRAFIADASHELRSPLASLRTQLEVTAAHPEGAEAAEVASEALEDVVRLEALTRDLLVLARLDADNPHEVRRIDAVALVAELLGRRRGDRVPVHFDAPAATWVMADPDQIQQVLTNLMDNAVRHALGRVEVRVGAPGGAGGPVTITVTDDGPGIPETERERVFERFVRLDATRSRDDGGTGLGLAIAKELARANAGDVRLLDGGPSASLCLTLPAA